MDFTNKNRGGTLSPPPPIITKVCLPLIITKVNAEGHEFEHICIKAGEMFGVQEVIVLRSITV